MQQICPSVTRPPPSPEKPCLISNCFWVVVDMINYGKKYRLKKPTFVKFLRDLPANWAHIWNEWRKPYKLTSISCKYLDLVGSYKRWMIHQFCKHTCSYNWSNLPTTCPLHQLSKESTIKHIGAQFRINSAFCLQYKTDISVCQSRYSKKIVNCRLQIFRWQFDFLQKNLIRWHYTHLYLQDIRI